MEEKGIKAYCHCARVDYPRALIFYWGYIGRLYAAVLDDFPISLYNYSLIIIFERAIHPLLIEHRAMFQIRFLRNRWM